MALSWRIKRKLSITTGIILVVGIPLVAFVVARLNVAPTCFDGIQNQQEAGIDCGGPCDLSCAKGNVGLVVNWARSVLVSSGVYDVVAYIDNDLDGAAIKRIHYTFRVYGDDGKVIAEREGTTFVNPGESFVVYEPGIETGYKIPERTSFSFENDPTWTRTTENPPDIQVRERHLSNLNTKPELRAKLENNELISVKNIPVIAVVYDQKGNAIGVSGTFIEKFPRTSEKVIHFTWPEPFDGKASRVEIIPRVSVFHWESPLPSD